MTGCGNSKEDSNNNVTDSNKTQVKETSNKIIDWNKDRVGDSLSTSDNETDNIIYRVEQIEDGDYIVYLKNNNNYGVNLFVYLDFYDSSESADSSVSQGQSNISCLKAGGIGAIKIKNVTTQHDSYKVRLLVQEKEFEDASQYVEFEEYEKDGDLKINAINNSNDEIKGLVVSVVYYLNNKIVAFDEADVGYGRYAIVTEYPKDNDGNKIEYDKYEIYLNTAYISQ
jgi:hypothetical protein